MDKNEQVVLVLADWNDTDKHYQMTLGRLLQFKTEVEKDGIKAAHKKMVQEVDYGENPERPITFGKVDMRNDNYFIAWNDVEECLTTWDMYLS